MGAEDWVSMMKITAESGLFQGRLEIPGEKAYMQRATVRRWRDGVTLIYTRDTGHHTCGWWKNPDYERCYHLSISFFDPESRMPRQFVSKQAEAIARLFFGHDTRWIWVEPPYTNQGKLCGVHHYRLFCDQGWQPIKPRGEVYSKDFTELGWKSFSEIHGEPAQGVKA